MRRFIFILIINLIGLNDSLSQNSDQEDYCSNQAYRAINRLIASNMDFKLSKARTSKANSLVYGQNLIYVEVEIKRRRLKVLRQATKYDIPELLIPIKSRDKEIPRNCKIKGERFHFVVVLFHERVSEKYQILDDFVADHLDNFVLKNEIPGNFEWTFSLGSCSHCSWEDVQE